MKEEKVSQSPKRGLTREALAIMNAAAGKPVEYSVPGELLEDVDGQPLGVGPTEVGTAILGRPIISQAEADRLGVTQEEFPNVHII
ncbi:hypothetical protein [Microlunatus sp. Y2014]|uniref:hypothetical protein n=1 Tax=Microlunatus sp. Y2014 TaxID=3418488 RepID=UPI003DA6D365